MLALMDAERSGQVSTRQQRRDATLYTTLEPCHLCMAAAMCFLLGRVVFAAAAPIDGGASLPELWQPPNGHPADGMPYTIPVVAGGVAAEASTQLIGEWIGRDWSTRSWAAGYLPGASDCS
jgi:tRNA(Arg) A34 adenosine deaminase TadA